MPFSLEWHLWVRDFHGTPRGSVERGWKGMLWVLGVSATWVSVKVSISPLPLSSFFFPCLPGLLRSNISPCFLVPRLTSESLFCPFNVMCHAKKWKSLKDWCRCCLVYLDSLHNHFTRWRKGRAALQSQIWESALGFLLPQGSAQGTRPKDSSIQEHHHLYSYGFHPVSLLSSPAQGVLVWGDKVERNTFLRFPLKSPALFLSVPLLRTLKGLGFWMTKAKNAILVSVLYSILPLKQ